MAIYTTDTTPRRGMTVVSKNDDYGEVMAWADDNPEAEDRAGYFVCFDHDSEGFTVKKAGVDDDVRGVSITNPAFASNVTPDKYDDKGLLLPKYTYIGWTGFVPIIDKGRCTAGGRCMPDSDGTAKPSSNNMGYQVIERIDDSRVLILVEPQGDMIQRIRTDITDINKMLDYLTRVDKPAENVKEFKTAGTKTWTCPEGVFKVCALIQGGGQGGRKYKCTGGSGVKYYLGIPEMSSGKAIFVANIPVTPKKTYTFTIGAGGAVGGEPDTKMSGQSYQFIGSAGSFGGASEAFGYSSDNANYFKYQYLQKKTTLDIYWNSEDISEAEAQQNYALSVNGSISNAYHSDGSYGYQNGASSFYKAFTPSSGTTYNSGAGKAGAVVLFY